MSIATVEKETVDNRAGAKSWFDKGNGVNKLFFSLSEAKESLEIGLTTGDTPDAWTVWRSFSLTYYGSDIEKCYEELLEEANTLLSEAMEASAKDALQAAMVDKSTLTTDDQLLAAIKALSETINETNNSVALYRSIKDALDKIQAMDPELALTEMWNDYENGKFESLEDVNQYYEVFQQLEIAKLGTEENTDYTLAIINPSFELGNTFGWTFDSSNDSGAKDNSNATYTVSNADGNYVFNIWMSGNRISQTIEGLPEGRYKLDALIATDADHQVKLIANNQEIAIDASVVGKGLGVRGEVEFNVVDGKATIGAEGVDSYWYKVDDFHLTYISGIPTATINQLKDLLDQAADLLTSGPGADPERLKDLALAYNEGLMWVNAYNAGTNLNDKVAEVLAAIVALQQAIDNYNVATGISTVSTEQGGSTIYNLGGQKVNTLRKGVYIINGKKVVK